MGFCEYSIVNMIIDQLKHSDGGRRIKHWNVWRELLEIRVGWWLEHRAELLDSQWKDRLVPNSSAEIGHIDIYL